MKNFYFILCLSKLFMHDSDQTGQEIKDYPALHVRRYLVCFIGLGPRAVTTIF